jgi:hypothetical protein
MITEGIQYAVDAALGNKSNFFHTASSPSTGVIPSGLVGKSNVDQHYNPDSTF